MDLLPGQRWQQEIPRALKNADFILIFFSRNSVAKRGYVQREFKLALDTLQEIPEDQIHTIPIRLDECDIPPQFGFLQWCNFFEADGFKRLERAIQTGLLQHQPPESSVPEKEPRVSETIVHEIPQVIKPGAEHQHEAIKPSAQTLLTKAEATYLTTTQIWAGDKEKAQELYATALEIARSFKSELGRAEALSAIATAQAQAGNLSTALEIARSIEDKESCAEAFHAITTAQAQAGDLSTALEAARSIEDKERRAFALSAIATAQVQTGDKGKAREICATALETARSIEDKERRAFALSAIATAQVQTGDKGKAREICATALEAARSIEDKERRGLALRIVARAQAQTGDLPTALEIAFSSRLIGYPLKAGQ
jgi:tetratricopeptide (TPR) repeat protein